jgi:hypothetical protein
MRHDAPREKTAGETRHLFVIGVSSSHARSYRRCIVELMQADATMRHRAPLFSTYIRPAIIRERQFDSRQTAVNLHYSHRVNLTSFHITLWVFESLSGLIDPIRGSL